MCADCFDDDDEVDQLQITQELIYHARRIEEDLSGELLSEDAWAIFFGSKSGSIVWADHERMARCREAATTLLSMHSARI